MLTGQQWSIKKKTDSVWNPDLDGMSVLRAKAKVVKPQTSLHTCLLNWPCKKQKSTKKGKFSSMFIRPFPEVFMDP